eukprot:6180780-Pleurochrysis_carterae.AAC.1
MHSDVGFGAASKFHAHSSFVRQALGVLASHSHVLDGVEIDGLADHEQVLDALVERDNVLDKRSDGEGDGVEGEHVGVAQAGRVTALVADEAAVGLHDLRQHRLVALLKLLLRLRQLPQRAPTARRGGNARRRVRVTRHAGGDALEPAQVAAEQLVQQVLQAHGHVRFKHIEWTHQRAQEQHGAAAWLELPDGRVKRRQAEQHRAQRRHDGGHALGWKGARAVGHVLRLRHDKVDLRERGAQRARGRANLGLGGVEQRRA